ncbi:MAG: FG-GAP-like repeat-containing protein, partial [Candidatus Marinimicrobia bacterium]|nr:FG-GAP-like repeat-containing protein [Candidatus Neomarinimicrobiota bacterium]
MADPIMDWGDYDNDGDLDLVFGGVDNSQNFCIKIYRNDGGHLVEQDTEKDIIRTCPKDAKWVDLNNDGRLDLIIGGVWANEYLPQSTLCIYENKVEAGQIKFVPKFYKTFRVLNMQCADLNNDGYIDLIVTGYDTAIERSCVKIYFNEGNFKFCEANLAIGGSTTGGDFKSVAVTDYNADGYIDIAFNNASAVMFYKNNGMGEFTIDNEQNSRIIIQEGLGDYHFITWGDYDNNRWPDLISYYRYGTYIYRNINGELNHDNKYLLPTNYDDLCRIAWGDFESSDNENGGDLGLLCAGAADISGHNNFTYLFKNYESETGNKNYRPSIPRYIDCETNKYSGYGNLIIKWKESLDPAEYSSVEEDLKCYHNLGYNVKVGTSVLGTGEVLGNIVSDNAGKSYMGNAYRTIVVDNDGTLVDFMGFKLENILPDKTYYWQIQAIDQGFKRSIWTEVESAYVGVAPAKITDMVAKAGPENDKITLSWTSPGNNGSEDNIINGEYCVKYSTYLSRISENEYGIASTYVEWSMDTTPGQAETKTIERLVMAEVPHYFQIKTDDGNENWSQWSDVISDYKQYNSSDGVVFIQYVDANLEGQTTNVYINKVDTGTTRAIIALSTAQQVGLYAMSNLYDIHPDSVVFSPGALITFKYDLPLPEDVFEDELDVYRFDEKGEWNKIVKTEQNFIDHWIKVRLYSTSIYAIMAMRPPFKITMAGADPATFNTYYGEKSDIFFQTSEEGKITINIDGHPIVSDFVSKKGLNCFEWDGADFENGTYQGLISGISLSNPNQSDEREFKIKIDTATPYTQIFYDSCWDAGQYFTDTNEIGSGIVYRISGLFGAYEDNILKERKLILKGQRQALPLHNSGWDNCDANKTATWVRSLLPEAPTPGIFKFEIQASRKEFPYSPGNSKSVVRVIDWLDKPSEWFNIKREKILMENIPDEAVKSLLSAESAMYRESDLYKYTPEDMTFTAGHPYCIELPLGAEQALPLLKIYRFDDIQQMWVKLENQFEDTENNRIVAEVNKLGTFAILSVEDNEAPEINNLTAAPNPFSPNRDGTDETTAIMFNLFDNESEYIPWTAVEIFNQSGGPIRTIFKDYRRGTGQNEIIWDGIDDNGKIVPVGDYKVRVTATDLAGNSSERDATVKVRYDYIVDDTPPTTPVVDDDGDYTNSTRELYCQWQSADPYPESGITDNRYQLYSITPQGLREWIDTGNHYPEVRSEAQAVILNDFMYIIGGERYEGDEIFRVDYNKIKSDGSIDPQSWIQAADLPEAMSRFSAVTYGGRIYLISGFHTSSVYYTEPDPVTGAITGW